jgi:hypothetical protein
MKGSSIILALHHLKMSKDFFQDCIRQHPGTKGANLFSVYTNRIEWIYRDIITTPALPAVVVAGIKKEWTSDAFTVPALNEKIAVLNPEQREAIENIIDKVLAGEVLTVEKI